MITSLLLLLSGPAVAQDTDDIVIVVNARNPTASLGANEVKNMFLGNVAFWHGTVPVHLVVQPATSDAGTRFVTEVLGSTPQRFESAWQARQLAGRGVAPKVASSAAELVAWVGASPGAIGYLLASEAWASPLPAGVKIVETD